MIPQAVYPFQEGENRGGIIGELFCPTNANLRNQLNLAAGREVIP